MNLTPPYAVVIAVCGIFSGCTSTGNPLPRVRAAGNALASGAADRPAEARGALSRAGFEQSFAVLADPSGIPWFQEVLLAYQRAVETQKLLVIYFEFDECDYCRKLEAEVLRSPEMAVFANRAVFAVASPLKDKIAESLRSSLKVEDYPSVVVLEARPDVIVEKSRIIGYFERQKFLAKFEECLRQPAASEQP